MNWDTIRAHYAALLAESGRTQHAVAVAGGLSGQNAISKLLANTKRGPSVETLVRAVIGLGVPLSVFFAALEDVPATPASPVSDRLRDLEQALADLRASSQVRSHEPPSSPVPSSGHVVTINLLDEQRIAAIVQAVFDRLHQRLAGRSPHGVEPTVETRAGGDSAAPPGCATHCL
jgi:transcriptional regulator with XRE-family HTH domain